jgi:hypothetical protein
MSIQLEQPNLRSEVDRIVEALFTLPADKVTAGDVLINQMQEPTPPITHAQKIASQLKLPIPKVAATIDLLTAGNTLPFIARYRKEATGGLDEEQIAAIMAALATLQALDERRATVLAAIAEQGKLTPELQAQIEPRPRAPSWKTSTRPTSRSAAPAPVSPANWVSSPWPT